MTGLPADSWSTQQLAEFLAAMSSFTDQESAVHGAVERAAEALDAEVAAVIRDGAVAVSIGFPEGEAPEEVLHRLAETNAAEGELPGLGLCTVAREPLYEGHPTWLLIGRTGEPVTSEERVLLSGMARVLGLFTGMIARQQLLERVSEIQRQIVRRAAPREVLDAIVAGAAELTSSHTAGLRQLDPRDPGRMTMVATTGFSPQEIAALRDGRVGDGVAGRSIEQDQLVSASDYPNSDKANPVIAEMGVHAAMAAPVREAGQVIGSLVVGSRQAGRVYSAAEGRTLQTFAEHASLALTDAKMVEAALYQAVHDSLTDLPNRTLFADRLEHALARADRTSEQLAVLFMDLDRFKTVNDSLGHAAGDDLLVQTARRLGDCIRAGDTAARFGGDEFAVLLEGASPREAEEVAARILAALEKPFVVADREVFVSASIGIAMGSVPADDPLRDADLAMYRAKGAGKGRFELFESGMHTAVVERLELEGDMQGAAARDELLLHYQPIVELATERVVGVEALIRWRHPVRGLLPPAAFIPLAEETRQMPMLGRWVLGEACRQAAEWRGDHGAATPLVTVNLSAHELGAPDLVADVEGALERSGLPADGLVLEITETVLMHDIAATADKLARLKSLGVRLAVDDFGTGYSSLQYLRRFPIDFLKIDKVFVDDLGGNGNGDPSLARAIIDLGESFRLDVIAEGIEHETQRLRLLDLGCGLGQGYLFTKPVDAAAAGAMLGGEWAILDSNQGPRPYQRRALTG